MSHGRVSWSFSEVVFEVVQQVKCLHDALQMVMNQVQELRVHGHHLGLEFNGVAVQPEQLGRDVAHCGESARAFSASGEFATHDL